MPKMSRIGRFVHNLLNMRSSLYILIVWKKDFSSYINNKNCIVCQKTQEILRIKLVVLSNL